ncbi:MAG: hypothetical protein KAQ83_01785, partial [Nanoarchaeota archaeon]|nr:hypothetical protein [Nanoarchaeota archaeon]
MILIGYGSLLNQSSFERTIPWREPKEVIVNGYKRTFNLIPSRLQLYKLYDANHAKGEIAVLNAVPDRDYHINAGAFELSEAEIDIIKVRLKSYHAEEAEILDPKTRKRIGTGIIFIGDSTRSGEKILNNDILPIPKYLKTCTEGALAMGKSFYKTWLETTFLG